MFTLYLRLFLSGIAILIWFYWLWSRLDFYRFAWKFNTVWGLPYLGILPYMTAGLKDFLPVIGQILAKHHHTVCVWFGTTPFLLTAEPHLIGSILKSNQLLNKAASFYKPIAAVLTNGLVTSSADVWQQHRRVINPTFRHSVLISFLDLFEKLKRNLINDFESLNDAREHAIYHIIEKRGLACSVETIMDTKIDVEIVQRKRMIEKINFLLAAASTHALFSLIQLGWLYALTPKNLRLIKQLQGYLKEVLNAKLVKSIGNSCENSQHLADSAYIKKKDNIFIKQIIASYKKEQFFYNDMVGESNSMVIAAFETTSNILYSTILLLAMHPEVQERLFEEIFTVFPDKDFQFEYEHMSQLPYFDMVLNEVMRLVPPIPVIGRMTVDETYINEHITLPKNMEILISIYHLHRRKDIWGANADDFDPERFQTEHVSKRHAYAYIPFSKGTRNCIGWRYALFLTKVVLTGLIRNFRFSSEFKMQDLEFIFHITMKYYVEPKIKLEKR